MKPILLDTGVIVALLDKNERYHEVCTRTIADLPAPLVTCEAVIVESCYLLRRVRGAADAILHNVSTGVFQIPIHLSGCAPQLQRIFRKYRDREIDLADAFLIHLAGELKTGTILTLDRDFRVCRWGGNKTFDLLISLDSA